MTLWWILSILGVLILLIACKVALWLTQRQQRANLLARCNYEHEAWRRGDDALAFYGQYPPPAVKVGKERIRIWSDRLPAPAGAPRDLGKLREWPGYEHVPDHVRIDGAEPLDDAIRNFVY